MIRIVGALLILSAPLHSCFTAELCDDCPKGYSCIIVKKLLPGDVPDNRFGVLGSRTLIIPESIKIEKMTDLRVLTTLGVEIEIQRKTTHQIQFIRLLPNGLQDPDYSVSLLAKR